MRVLGNGGYQAGDAEQQGYSPFSILQAYGVYGRNVRQLESAIELIEEDSVDDSFDRLIDGGIIENDVRGFAAKLERQLFVAASELPHDDLPDFRRSGESDLGRGGMIDDGSSRFTGAANQIHHSRW